MVLPWCGGVESSRGLVKPPPKARQVTHMEKSTASWERWAGNTCGIVSSGSSAFMSGGQFNRAVEMYAASKNYTKALELCVNHNISVTEELAGSLSIPKGEGSEEQRLAALDQIAEAWFLQANYHLATKKWTQAGMRHKAMKALLKSGDTEKIIFFANVSRQAEIYVLGIKS